jgi:hypothetical protein
MANASTALLKKLETLARDLNLDGHGAYAQRVLDLVDEVEMPTAVPVDKFGGLGANRLPKPPPTIDGKRCRFVAFDIPAGWADVVPVNKQENAAGPVERVDLFCFGHTVVGRLAAVQKRRAPKGYQGVFPLGYQRP